MVAKGVPWTHGAYVGGAETPEHYVWRSMLSRCNRPNDKSFAGYGGRGIRVEWSSYAEFLNDMGRRPSDQHSIDRIDVNGNYSKANCRWATRSEQQSNTQDTKTYTDGDFSGTLTECAEYIGISKALAHWRYKTWGTFKRGANWWLRPKIK